MWTSPLYNRKPYFNKAWDGEHMRQFADSLRQWVTQDLELALADVSLVGTGMSGAFALGQVGAALGMSMAIVRKDDDSTHSTHMIEGVIKEQWVFLDDFLDTGDTLLRVLRAIHEVAPDAVYLGTALYSDWGNGKFEITSTARHPQRGVMQRFRRQIQQPAAVAFNTRF